VRARPADGLIAHRCSVDNIASNRLVDTLEFTLVTTVGVVSSLAEAETALS